MKRLSRKEPLRGGSGPASRRTGLRWEVRLGLQTLVTVLTLLLSSLLPTRHGPARLVDLASADSTTFYPGKDSYLEQHNPGNNFGTTSELEVISHWGAAEGSNRRAVLYFDISTIPQYSTINSATLRLYLSSAPDQARTHEVYRLTSEWTEGGVTWNSPWTTAGGDYATPPAAASASVGTTNGVWVTWDITSLVQGWLDGSYPNYGLLVKDSVEDSVDKREAKFTSREYNGSDPELVIDYTPPDTTPPNDPTNLNSSSHTTASWSNDNTVDLSWTAATDPGTPSSGVDGYSYTWDTTPDTVPDTTKDIEETATSLTSAVLADGNSHYFHTRTVDNAGNWTSTLHLGPFYIDATDPGTSGHSSAKGATNVARGTDIVVHVTDAGSGVDQSSIVMTVEGATVTPTITGSAADYTLTYDPPTDFNYGQVVNVTVDADDLAGNNMAQDAYSFTIRQRRTTPIPTNTPRATPTPNKGPTATPSPPACANATITVSVTQCDLPAAGRSVELRSSWGDRYGPLTTDGAGEATFSVTGGSNREWYAIVDGVRMGPTIKVTECGGTGTINSVFPCLQTPVPTATPTGTPPTGTPTPTSTPSQTPTPTPQISPPRPETPAPTQTGVYQYTVQRGDTCYSLARRFGTKVQDLIELNGLDAACSIQAGQRLNILVGGQGTDTPTSTPIATNNPAAMPTPTLSAEALGAENLPTTGGGVPPFLVSLWLGLLGSLFAIFGGLLRRLVKTLGD